MDKHMWVVVKSQKDGHIINADWASQHGLGGELILYPEVTWERTGAIVGYLSAYTLGYSRQWLIQNVVWPDDERMAYETEVIVAGSERDQISAGLPQSTASFFASLGFVYWDDDAGVYRLYIDDLWKDMQRLLLLSSIEQDQEGSL